MRSILTISLAFVIIVASSSNAVIFLMFKLDQERIIEKWCVNKDKPQMKCHGKCYLGKQMAESHGDGSEKIPPVSFEDVLRINFFFSPLEAVVFERAEFRMKPHFSYTDFLPQAFVKSFFHPPDFRQPTV